MKKETKKLKNSNNAEEILEFIRTARTLKRQIRLVSGIELEQKETNTIKLALSDLKNEIAILGI
jgi:hypothetical protein